MCCVEAVLINFNLWIYFSERQFCMTWSSFKIYQILSFPFFFLLIAPLTPFINSGAVSLSGELLETVASFSCRLDPPWGWLPSSVLGRAQSTIQALLPAISLNLWLLEMIWNTQGQIKCQHLATKIAQILKHIHFWGAVVVDQIGIRELQNGCLTPCFAGYAFKQILPCRIAG